MRFPGWLRPCRLVMSAAFFAMLASAAVAVPAWAGPAPGLCGMHTSRGAVPAGFPIDACVDGSSIWLYNSSTLDLAVAATGSVSSPRTTVTNPTLAVDATRLHSGNQWLLLPGDKMQIPIGSGSAEVRLGLDKSAGFYALALTAQTYVPIVNNAVLNSYTQFIAEVNADFANYQNCKAGRNFLGQAACTAGFIGDVTFAVGRVAVALAADGLKVGVKSLLAPLLATATFLQWVDAQVTQLTVLVHAPALNQAARSQSAESSGGSASPPNRSNSPSSPSGNASISIGWSTAHPGWISMTLQGLPVGAYSYSCNFGSGGDQSFSLTETTEPQTLDNGRTCFDTESGDTVWVTIGSVQSNTITVSNSAPPPPPPAPAPSTYAETTGGVTHTWTNYSNAGGTEGASIPSFDSVQIACKVTGFKVADGNTWWYRIASSPWNDAYYASADAFYNNGQTSGPLKGTPFVDPNVPNC
jgi:hypothetical protein